MGRGRQKAKQRKVARNLKYFTPDTDYQALERELRGLSIPNLRWTLTLNMLPSTTKTGTTTSGTPTTSTAATPSPRRMSAKRRFFHFASSVF
ncbi:hypothetical protein DDD63_10295 [Actinobaculum sp. 313]|nr:hypothetical protein DDD63_10295 [Actinobaculum sp. 313]